MIVRNVETGWEIVFQSAHALLAGCLATQLRHLSDLRYGQETLAAILDHDDHKEAFGRNVYLTELGAPKDFTQFQFTARERYEEVHRRIDSGYRSHRWIGLLAARHAEELYRNIKVSSKLAKLLADERQRRDSMLHDLRTTNAELEDAYSILQWCDRTSLILCQHALPAMHRRLEISTLGDGQRYEIWETGKKTVSVDPWPFKCDSFDVQLEVRSLSNLTFRTDTELQRNLWRSPVEVRSWTFSCE